MCISTIQFHLLNKHYAFKIYIYIYNNLMYIHLIFSYVHLYHNLHSNNPKITTIIFLFSHAQNTTTCLFWQLFQSACFDNCFIFHFLNPFVFFIISQNQFNLGFLFEILTLVYTWISILIWPKKVLDLLIF